MDVKVYMEVQNDIRVMANHLVSLCGEEVVSKLSDDFIVDLLQTRLSILEDIEEFESTKDKIECVIMCLLSISAMAKVEHDIDVLY